jgi:hypothetical protein
LILDFEFWILRHMNLGIYFHLMGFIIAGSACIAIGRTAKIWRGPFRDELTLMAAGFGVFAVAFVWQVFKNFGTPEALFLGNMADSLFLFAIAPLAIGASAIFTYAPPQFEGGELQKNNSAEDANKNSQ